MQLDRSATIFEIAPIERDAEKLRQSDPAAACLVRSGIAALKWDADGVRREVESANRLVPKSASFLINSALSFKLINDLRSAEEYAKLALQHATNDRLILRKVAGYMAQAGSISEAAQTIKVREHMGLDVDDLKLGLDSLIDWLSQLDINEDQLKTEIAIALELLSKRKIKFVNIEFEKNIFHDEGGFGLSTVIEFVGDFQTEMELESELADRLIDLPTWDLSKLSTEFRHVDSHELQAA